MTITGLENNYYLSFNDIWISVGSFTEVVSILEITVTNLTTGTSLPAFELSPSPDNDFDFNICIPVRYLFPETNHVNVNSLQSFEINFKAIFENTSIPDENILLTKFFVRGGRNKNGIDEWYLSPSYELIIGKWIEWRGITLPGFANKIQGNKIVDFIPTSSYKILNPSCDYKILKFLNSLGGYQYFIFEKYEIKNSKKAGKVIIKKTNRLRYDNSRNLANTTERIIEFQANTPWEIQQVFTELVNSPEVFIYNPDGTDNDSKWEELLHENNESIQDNWTRKYENKIKFSFANYK